QPTQLTGTRPSHRWQAEIKLRTRVRVPARRLQGAGPVRPEMHSALGSASPYFPTPHFVKRSRHSRAKLLERTPAGKSKSLPAPLPKRRSTYVAHALCAMTSSPARLLIRTSILGRTGTKR